MGCNINGWFIIIDHLQLNCWELNYQAIGFLPSSWLSNGYHSVYMTLLSFLLHRYNLYQHFYYFYYVQSSMSPPFLILLSLLTLLLVFLFWSSLPETTTAKSMEAGSSLGRSADLRCWCYSHLHFFSITYSIRYKGLRLAFQIFFPSFFFPSLHSPLPHTHLCLAKHLEAFSVSSSCAHALVRSLRPSENNGRPSKETVRNRAQAQLFPLQNSCIDYRFTPVINNDTKNQ